MRVSLTEFVDFVITSGSPKLTRVRTAKKRREEPYHPAKDFWKPLRERIVEFHRTGETDKAKLSGVLARVSPRKRERYRACIRGYSKFLGRSSYTWFDPPSATWGPNDLSVSVNPELGLTQDEDSTAVKLYFKNDKLSKRRIDLILVLMREALRRKLDAGVRVGILDVPRGKLYSTLEADRSLLPLLEGEADSFATMWNRL